MAIEHAAGAIRWWPPSRSATRLHFLVERAPDSLPALRADLERELGCRVSVYTAEQIPREAWGRVLVEPVRL